MVPLWIHFWSQATIATQLDKMAPCEFYFNLTLGFGGSRFYTKFIPGITTGVKFPLTSKLRCLNWLDFRGRFKLRKVRRGNLRVKSDTIGPLAQIQSSTFHSNVQRAFFSLGGQKYQKFLKKVLSVFLDGFIQIIL